MDATPEKWRGREANEETRTAAWRAEIKSGAQVERLADSWAAAERMARQWARAPWSILVPTFPDRQLVVVQASLVDQLFSETPEGEGPAGAYWLGITGRRAKVWATAYDHARAQSDRATPKSDQRPFIFGVMPPGTSDGFAVFDRADWAAVHSALLTEWAKT